MMTVRSCADARPGPHLRAVPRFLTIALLLVPISAVAKRRPPVACDPGTFLVAPGDQAKLATLIGAATTFTLGPAGAVTLGSCGATGKVKPKRRKTIVSARFTTCGTATKATLAVTLAAPDCSVARGTLRAKRRKRMRFTATRTTTTPLPGLAVCGNGVRDGAEACEGVDGCGPGTRCAADCTCVPAPSQPSTSLGLIANALAAGTIDYPTSLVYRAYALFGDSRLPPVYDGALRRGEDQGLFLEASRMWGTLTPEMRAALEPFMVRPSDPKSIHAAPPPGALRARPALARAAAPGTSLADLKCPYAPGQGTPDWRATESTHFVVWSCGGGNLALDPDAALRPIVAGVAEEVWNAMTPEAVPPRPDSFAAGPAPQNRIDIYILQGADCHDRQGACAPIETDENGKRPLAAVIPAPPCDRSGGGALTSSAYMLVDRDSVAAAPAGGPWKFRYVFAHEFFHVLADAMNLEAQGASCFDPAGGASTLATSWLSEASAEWAAWAFFPNDGPDERTNLFLAFQEYRPPHVVSLLAIDGQRPYEAFLYPFFLQQEKGGARTPFLGMWTASSSARKPEELDDRLDQVLGFADHFRDFTVRNFNKTVELPPSEPHYQGQDSAIPANESPNLLEPTMTLDHPGVKFQRAAILQPLTAQYEHYMVQDSVRYVRIDAGRLANSGFVDLDALANVRGVWQRRKAQGGVLEFCREDAADDVQGFYLVVTNHDRRRGQTVSGSYDVEMRAACPAGWTGTLKYVYTDDDAGSYSDANASYTKDDHLRVEETWTLVTTTNDTIDAVWTGSFTQNVLETYHPTACIGYEVTLSDVANSGSGTGPQQFTVVPSDQDPDQVYLQAMFPTLNVITVTGSRHEEQCNTAPTTQALTFTWDDGLSQLSGTLPLLVAAPNDPGHYTGTFTSIHDVRTGIGIDSHVTDAQTTWDIHRRRAQGAAPQR
jgi:hypothetical protein